MTYDPSRPETWSTFAASGFFLGLDVGLMQDHSALVLGAYGRKRAMRSASSTSRQFPLGTALEDVADEAARLAREHTAGIVFDASNNSAFAGVLAARVPPPAVNWVTAAVITNASGHAAQPTPMPLALGGLRTAVRRWTLSKSELVETISAELGNRTLRIAKKGDWEILQDELQAMERTVRASGTATYSAPPGKHDDLVMALSSGGVRVPAARQAHAVVPSPSRDAGQRLGVDLKISNEVVYGDRYAPDLERTPTKPYHARRRHFKMSAKAFSALEKPAEFSSLGYRSKAAPSSRSNRQ